MKKILATILMVLMLTAAVFADTKKPEPEPAAPTAAELEAKMEELTKWSKENQAKMEEITKRFEMIMKTAETEAKTE